MQPENTEQKGMGWASLSLEAAALQLVQWEGSLRFPRGCGHRLSCPSVPPVAHFPPNLSFCPLRR